jgi:hypothetical protein
MLKKKKVEWYNRNIDVIQNAQDNKIFFTQKLQVFSVLAFPNTT